MIRHCVRLSSGYYGQIRLLLQDVNHANNVRISSRLAKHTMLPKVINDCIHGLINIPGHLFKFIDTPQFQRLKNIKQVGGTYYVYPGAAHNRFEHSIGVCYLAGRLARNLQRGLNEDIEHFELLVKEENNESKRNKYGSHLTKLKKAKMCDEDLECIEIAALCHDLGHGPMSHLFDQMFYATMKRTNPKLKQNWTHEKASQEMFDLIVEENNIEMKDTGKQFVKNLIIGKPFDEEEPARRYMYEIVANERNGIDVDRMDSFGRDCHGLGMRSNFDHLRYFLNCKVNVIDNVTGETSICSREKELFDLVDLFRTRDGLYRKAYRHRVTSAIQFMISDVFISANDHVKVTNKDGIPMTMMESLGDITAYQKFTDGILDYIVMSDDKNLKGAKEILNRIHKRDIYKCILETCPVEVTKSKDVELREENEIKDAMAKSMGIPLYEKQNWIVERVEYKMGFRDVYFYKKGNGEFFKLKAPGKHNQEDDLTGGNVESKKVPNWIDVEASLLLPTIMKEKMFRVYSKTHCRKACEDEDEFKRENDKKEEIKQKAKKVLEEKGFKINPLI